MPTLPNAHALIVGIANYQHVNPLPATVRSDAAAVRGVLVDPALGAYPPEHATLLLDGAATQQALRQALARLAAVDGEATVFFYVSSHGGRLETGPHAVEYLLPVDASYSSAERLAQSSISSQELTAALAAIPARRLVVVFDCCHAGGIGQPKAANLPAIKTGLSDALYDRLKSGRGRAILASSRSSELSWIMPGAAHSLFTSHLLAGLRGEANGAGGVIRIFDLFDYVQPRVTAERPDQHPVFKAEIEENFPLALHRGGQKAAPAVQTTVPPAAQPRLDDGYAYDVFISYSGAKEDRAWVRSYLLPYLEGQQIRVAVDFRAPLGLPKLALIEQAVQTSRYTVPVLSPAYLASGLADFENQVAQYLGTEQGAYRLLPVMAAPCTPRLGLRMLPILDLSDSDEAGLNLERLVDQMRRAPSLRTA